MFVKKLNNNAILPLKGSSGSAGYDVFSCEDKILLPKTRSLISTGISISIDAKDFYIRIAPRSGMAVKGIDVGAGVVDLDYRGEVKVLLINNSDSKYTIDYGDRIAQLIIEKIYMLDVINTSELDETDRGSGGFGSTGK